MHPTDIDTKRPMSRRSPESPQLTPAKGTARQGRRQVGWRIAVKRICDCAIAMCGLLIFAPILFCVAIMITFTMGLPIIFRQKRPGQDAKLFTLYKFRTMSNRRDPAGKLLSDSERLTRLGKVLRSTSLDELPQLWNVLRGDLSLVGPRPLLIEYLPRYSPEQSRRHEVIPGITGWAQINGRNALTWEEKFDLDLWYVDHWSLMLDVKILLITVLKVLSRNGIAQDGHATMTEFMGTSSHTDY
jgi:sugar transferase EpsL